MKSTGIVRKIDQLGRIVLPKELRATYSMLEGTPAEIFTEDDKIILGKYEPADIFTGSAVDLINYKGKKVSKETIVEMAKLAGFILVEKPSKKGGLVPENAIKKAAHVGERG